MHESAMRTRRVFAAAIAAVTVALLCLCSAIPAWAMTLTFVRHGESEANAAGIIDTQVPGPGLTPRGLMQAQSVAGTLAANGYDGFYASSMIRSQQTAYPLLDELGLSHDTLVVLPGLREISAGLAEGSSEDEGVGRLLYAAPPVAWTLGLRFLPIPGGEDGNGFDARVDDAVQQIYESGDQNAVAFAHGATIMFWVMMNVDNPDLTLLLTHQLDNTEAVVVEGSPQEGWHLVSWAGTPVAADPPLLTKLFVDVRDLVVAPQTALYNVAQAVGTGNPTTIANAVRDGTLAVAGAALGFVPRVVGDIVGTACASSPLTPSPLTSSQPMSANRPNTVSAAESPSAGADSEDVTAATRATTGPSARLGDPAPNLTALTPRNPETRNILRVSPNFSAGARKPSEQTATGTSPATSAATSEPASAPAAGSTTATQPSTGPASSAVTSSESGPAAAAA